MPYDRYRTTSREACLTMARAAYFFVFDGFADWEAASALAELRRTFGFSVTTFSLGGDPVVSMGGITVAADARIGAVRPESAEILILPGGDAWMEREIDEVTALIRAVHQAGQPVAAICAATISLAHAGLLNDHRHTSNGAGFLAKFVPSYRVDGLYVKAPAVRDRLVITANGLAPFAFAAEIFRAVAPERAQDIDTYAALYARGLLDG
jgi:putative intracellular protease/amidase